MFDWIPNVLPIGGTVNVGCKQTATAWNLQPQAGVEGGS